MSTTAVYVVLAAGVSLALLAGLGIYAVRHRGRSIPCEGMQLFSCFDDSQEGLPLPDDNLSADWRGHAPYIHLYSGLVRCSPINQRHSRKTRTAVPAPCRSCRPSMRKMWMASAEAPCRRIKLVCKAACVDAWLRARKSLEASLQQHLRRIEMPGWRIWWDLVR